MEILWWVLIVLCLLFGFLGCFVNKFPGPLLVFIATLIGRFCLGIHAISIITILVVAILWIASIVINKKVLPMLAKKVHEYSSAGSWGATIGCLVGLPLIAVPETPGAVVAMAFVSLVILPFVFAFLFEFTKRKDATIALKAGTAAYCVYLASTIIKLLAFVYAIWAIFNMGH